MSFCSGVIFSFRHHSFIKTVLFLPLLFTISDGNHHHLTYISWENTCKQSYLYVLKILTVKTLLIINSCLVILPMIKNSVPSQYVSLHTENYGILPRINTLSWRSCHQVAVCKHGSWTKCWHNYLFFIYLFHPKFGNADGHGKMHYLPIYRSWMMGSLADWSSFLLTLSLCI